MKNHLRIRAMKLAIGTDERKHLTAFIALLVRQKGHIAKLLGPLDGDHIFVLLTRHPGLR